MIAPAPPRTGMPSGVIARQAAYNIANMIKKEMPGPTHTASMAAMGAACVASAGKGLTKGTAAAMTMYPIVPDHQRFPAHGRNDKETFGEIGLAGHWIKYMLHYLFMYKMQARPGWKFIPE
jgi:sulfide:quinone oxidoreductase